MQFIFIPTIPKLFLVKINWAIEIWWYIKILSWDIIQWIKSLMIRTKPSKLKSIYSITLYVIGPTLQSIRIVSCNCSTPDI